MHRRYRPWHYAEKVAALQRAAGPALTLGADVMVGFPGETDAEFEETLDMVRALPFGYLHLFPFSPRPGTRGWALHAAASQFPLRWWTNAWPRCALWLPKKCAAIAAALSGEELEAITLHTPAALAAQGQNRRADREFSSR